jgi:hypothetical protein
MYSNGNGGGRRYILAALAAGLMFAATGDFAEAKRDDITSLSGGGGGGPGGHKPGNGGNNGAPPEINPQDVGRTDGVAIRDVNTGEKIGNAGNNKLGCSGGVSCGSAKSFRDYLNDTGTIAVGDTGVTDDGRTWVGTMR